jgi:hypothetical protein
MAPKLEEMVIVQLPLSTPSTTVRRKAGGATPVVYVLLTFRSNVC